MTKWTKKRISPRPRLRVRSKIKTRTKIKMSEQEGAAVALLKRAVELDMAK